MTRPSSLLPKKFQLPFAIALAVVALTALGYFAQEATKKSDAERAVAMQKEMQASAPEAASTEPSAAVDGSTLVARVGSKEILRSDVDAFLKMLPEAMQQVPPDQLYALAQDQLVNNAIIDEKVASSDVRSSQAFKDRIAEIEKQLARGLFMEQQVNSKITPDMLQKTYKEHVTKMPKVEETKASHILVKDEALAKDIIAKLKSGAKFEDLAKENSIDKSSATGDLGYFTRADMVPEFAEAAFAVKPGAITETPVKTQFGWHVIKVEDRRMRPTPTLEEMKPVLEAELRRTEMENMMKSWRAAAKVDLFDPQGKPVAVQKASETQPQ